MFLTYYVQNKILYVTAEYMYGKNAMFWLLCISFKMTNRIDILGAGTRSTTYS